MFLNSILKCLDTKRKKMKNKKGGVNILLEFMLLLPFYFIIIMLLFDVLKFYYVYQVSTMAAYSASYNFSMTANVQQAMLEAESSFQLAGYHGDKFRNDDIVKGYIYEYKGLSTSFVPINEEKTVANIPTLTTGTYDNIHMCNRDIYGFKFEVDNVLLSTIPANRFTGGAIAEQSIKAIAQNHVFEMQRFDQGGTPCP